MKKRLLNILLTLCMILTTLPVTASAYTNEYYVDENGQRQTLTDCKQVTSYVTTWETGWYIVKGTFTIDVGVIVKGDVKLILADGCSLTVTVPGVNKSGGDPKAGINVAEGNILTIYGQTAGSGKLSATGSEIDSLTDVYGGGGAGIGGNGTVYDTVAGENCGTVIIYGGKITATGNSGGAGIGGGSGYSMGFTTTDGGNGGEVNIYGGSITATSNSTMPDYDVTVQVTFAPAHRLSVNLDGGNGGTAGGDYIGGAAVSINAGTRDGYIFNGWTSNNGGSFDNEKNSATTFIMPANDVTITATWTASGGGGSDWTPTPDPVPIPSPTPAEDTFIFTPSIITEMLEGRQRINIDNGLQIAADLDTIPRNDDDAIIIKASEIRDSGTLTDFYKSYPTQQALYKGYEVNFTIESSNRSAPVTELLGAITLRFQLTSEELRGIDPDTLVVYKEDDNGVITKLYGTYDWVTSTYTVTTNHLCNFFLMAQEASNKPWVNPFTDVADTDWFYSAVEFVNRYGFYMGTGADTFSPNDYMTRAMFWTVLGRVNGQKLSGNDAFDNARTWAMGAGITDGANPGDNITREQMVTILWRYVGSPKSNGDLSKFSDVGSVSDYASDAMSWAVENGIINGSDGALMPLDNATRAQASAILQRFIELARE